MKIRELKEALIDEFLLNKIEPPYVRVKGEVLKIQLQDVDLLSKMLNNITDLEIKITSQNSWGDGGSWLFFL